MTIPASALERIRIRMCRRARLAIAPIFGRRRLRGPMAALGTGLIAGLTLPAGAAPPAAHQTPAQPIATIPVAPFGYQPMGAAYTLLRVSSTSLDFIDNTHLLFTFHHPRLLSREAEQGHDDQSIRALVLDIPSGKLNATAEWRMHDRRPYLFAAGKGEFLLRQGSEIQRLDRDLVLHPFLRFQNNIQDVQISLDGQMLTVQSDLERHSEEKHRKLVEQAIADGENFPDEDVDIQMVRLDHRKVIAEAKSENPLRLTLTPAGYIKHHQLSSDDWEIRLHAFDNSERAITALTSTCTPNEEFIRADVLMVYLCSPKSDGRYVTSVDLEGKELWKGAWDAHFIGPNLALSEEGRDFAISWIVSSHPVDASFSLSDNDVQGQAVQVLDTATGHLLLSVNASPVASAGRNFALSADGTRLAVLNHGALEVYAVPADTAK